VCICQLPKTNLDFVLFKISQTIDETRQRATTNDRHDQSALEWKRVSLVVDRFLLLLVNPAPMLFDFKNSFAKNNQRKNGLLTQTTALKNHLYC
jgi:hypothetical protein